MITLSLQEGGEVQIRFALINMPTKKMPWQRHL
jgi:hypothetical protein